MRLLNVKLARSVWLLDLSDLNQQGKDLGRELVEWISRKYNFGNFPNLDELRRTMEHMGQTPLTFKGGRFTPGIEDLTSTERLRDVEITLQIYSDGFVAETISSTDHCDQFLENLLTSAAAEFELAYDPSMIREKLYVSELHLASDAVLEILNPSLRSFADRLSRIIPRGGPFQASAIGFWTEPRAPGGHLSFTFERQGGKPFSQKRYYSTAPTQTKLHLQLLAELEKIMLSPDSASSR